MAATINRWKHMLRKFRIAVFNDMVESEKKKKKKKKKKKNNTFLTFIPNGYKIISFAMQTFWYFRHS